MRRRQKRVRGKPNKRLGTGVQRERRDAAAATGYFGPVSAENVEAVREGTELFNKGDLEARLRRSILMSSG
jgi:hypothetical protein